jgi:uncharacterized protein (DUF362 family)
MPTVSLVRTPHAPSFGQVEAAVREAVALAGGLQEIVHPGQRVLLKPNLVGLPAHRRAGACTSPEVCRALAVMVRELGAHPIIAESAAVGTDTEAVIQFMGYGPLRGEGFEVLDLKRTPPATLTLPDGEVVQEIHTWEPAATADVIISVAVLKTHDQCEVTLGLKNLKGLITDADKRLLHRLGVTGGTCDLAAAFKPAFCVIDGIWCQEGLGPLHGIPLEMDLICAGRDVVAADAVAAAVMGFDLSDVDITRRAFERGLGNADMREITVVGAPIAAVGRRFMRFLEDERAHLPGSPQVLHAEGTCTGCRLGISSALFDMSRDGTFDQAGDYILVTGDVDLAGLDLSKVIAIGKCCPQEMRAAVTYVPGCPPNNIFIKGAILEKAQGNRQGA